MGRRRKELGKGIVLLIQMILYAQKEQLLFIRQTIGVRSNIISLKPSSAIGLKIVLLISIIMVHRLTVLDKMEVRLATYVDLVLTHQH